MAEDIDELKVSVASLKTAVGEAVGEIHSLADQLAAHETASPEVKALAAEIKAQADVLHAAVYPPSASVDPATPAA